MNDTGLRNRPEPPLRRPTFPDELDLWVAGPPRSGLAVVRHVARSGPAVRAVGLALLAAANAAAVTAALVKAARR